MVVKCVRGVLWVFYGLCRDVQRGGNRLIQRGGNRLIQRGGSMC